MTRIAALASIFLICGACRAAAPSPPLPVSIDLGPAIIRFEPGSAQPTPAAKDELDRLIAGYREVRPAFGGILLCAGKAEGDLARRRAGYVTVRIAQAGIGPVAAVRPDTCKKLGGYDEGAVLLLTRPI